jgi:hypothetical protein
MAGPVGLMTTYNAIGNREDLSNMIYRISPTETPFVSSAARETATNTKHEWQTDAIAAAVASNRSVEGNTASNTTVTPTARIFNYCEIGAYYFQISNTQQAVNPAGRSDEMAFQLVKYGMQLKRDIESACSQNNGGVAGASGTARASASLESWMSTNWTTQSASPTSTASEGFSSTNLCTAPVDATTAATLTEANVKAIIRACWTAGGQPKMILCGPFNKVKLSGFSGILVNNIFQQAGGQAKIVAGASAYVSDFGELQIVPSRFSRDKTVSVLDMDYWAIAYLRPFQSFPLGVTGDNVQRAVISEYCVVARNQAASGKVTDLTTS